ILMEPEGAEAEGWQTGVALDASDSMMAAYGKSLVDGPRGAVPEALLKRYQQQGWITVEKRDGRSNSYWTENAFRDAIERGHMRMTENEVEPLARQMTAYLAGGLDADGGTTLIYWACGDGRAFEVVGDITEEQCQTLEVAGPRQTSFGNAT